MTTTSVVTTRTPGATMSSASMNGIGCFICETGRTGIRIRWGFILTVAIFINQYPFTLCLIASNPMTAVSMEGGRVRMGCTRDWSDLPVDWEFAPAGSNKTSYIYTNRQIPPNLTSRYRIDTDNKTRYDIVIDSVDSSHAGTYICTVIDEGTSNAQSGSAQLMILESDPVCNTNASAWNDTIVEGDYIKMWCTVNYTGNWLPVMRWNSSSMGRHHTYTSETNSSTSSLIMALYAGDDRVTLACQTSFNPGNYKVVRKPRPGEVLATNIPDYQYWWTFTPSVLYAPKKIMIVPTKNFYVVGERLECSANGNPKPTYEWMEIKTNSTFHGSVLIIDYHIGSGKNHDFRCTAYNVVAGIRRQINETISFTVRGTGASSKAASTSLIALIALGFTVVLSVKARN